MTTTSAPESRTLLDEMAKIPIIIPGKLSQRRNTAGKVTGWKLQHWQDGRNQTHYIAASLAPQVVAGTEGYQRFRELADAYARQRGEEALRHAEETADSGKKKPTRPSKPGAKKFAP